MNQAMSGGHCEGMAVLASLFYFDYSSPSEFGADVTAELEFEGNELLQREIAYWFVTQATRPGNSLVVNESPRAVVDALVEAGADASPDHVADKIFHVSPLIGMNARYRIRTTLPADRLAVLMRDGADALVICTEWKAFRTVDFRRLRERVSVRQGIRAKNHGS